MILRSILPAAMTVAAMIATPTFARADTPAIEGCKSKSGMTPLCVVKQPEDLTALPGGKALIVSEIGNTMDAAGKMIWGPGRLSLLDLKSKKARPLYPMAGQAAGDTSWGDPACAGEIGDKLSPHGIHYSRREDGKGQLLVVNHGGRQSVEMFEVAGAGKSLKLTWRGCVSFPDAIFHNDVAALSKGGFITTIMMFDARTGALMDEYKKAAEGLNSGFLLRWRPGVGTDLPAGGLQPMPNGVQVSADDQFAFVAVAAGEVRKINLATGALAGAVEVPHGDNISWSDDGKLLVASVVDMSAAGPCIQRGFAAPCGAAFRVFRIDPETMASEIVLTHEGAPLGSATVAVQAGDALYVGSALGDRVMMAPMAKKAR